jgi:hypothetical protein
MHMRILLRGLFAGAIILALACAPSAGRAQNILKELEAGQQPDHTGHGTAKPSEDHKSDVNGAVDNVLELLDGLRPHQLE